MSDEYELLPRLFDFNSHHRSQECTLRELLHVLRVAKNDNILTVACTCVPIKPLCVNHRSSHNILRRTNIRDTMQLIKARIVMPSFLHLILLHSNGQNSILMCPTNEVGRVALSRLQSAGECKSSSGLRYANGSRLPYARCICWRRPRYLVERV